MTDLILPAQLTTELEAVNVLITSMGEEPYASIDPSPGADADKAIAALNETNRSLQSRGWHWNTEVAFPITPDPTTGIVTLPANMLEMSSAYYIPNVISGRQPWDVVARGTQLYDRTNHTFNFLQYGGPIYLDWTALLEWALIPEKARRVITLKAVQLYQSRDQASQPAMQVNAIELKEAWALLEQGEDQEAGPHNQLYDNLDTTSKILGNWGLQRNRLNG